MTAAPSRSFPADVADRDRSRIEDRPKAAAKYCRKILPEEFPRAAHQALLKRAEPVWAGARAFDADRYRAIFPDQWAAFLRRQFRSALEVQMFFSVSERTARGWWNGSGGRPTGDAVAAASLTFPANFARHLAPAA